MADFEAPSFSLGLDFDLIDSQPQITTANQNNKPQSTSNQFSKLPEYEDDDFETLTVLDSDPDSLDSQPKLKRLRRGSTVNDAVSSASVKSNLDLHSAVVVDDDDIEDFSSPEDNNRIDEHLSTHQYSVYNSSKVPLSGHGVLTKQSGKRKQSVSDGPESVITNCSKSPFPKLTVSPLRRFQLIDSDSDPDDPFTSEVAANKTFNGSESYLNGGQPNLVSRAGLNEHGKLDESVNTFKKDLWEDFQSEKTFRMPTPAFDAVCEEYFSAKKDKIKSEGSSIESKRNGFSTNSVIDLDDTCLPAHRYFFHHDPRVQELVRTRLRNFFPLNAANRDNEQPSTSNIDYMGQFSNGEKSKQATQTSKGETSSRRNSRKSKAQETSQGFTNPKRSTEKGVPKDAGKRRVQADGQAGGGGHWFTGSDGKRVYVSKNGREMTGRAAYILYKKESGGGFKKKNPKKKSVAKKK
ncbi:uncharacterized protein [Rutidosis leptorrhynchoides]|uniref:uncharacterized protein n=1 Tax=Rutidosis leptorrhynchoides TaxID=125765 RepID=UPI003A9A1E28